MTVPISPIVLFVYRRLDHVRQVLEALQRNPEARSSELFIYSDGPKDDATAPAVAAVRDFCKGVEGFAKVTLVERPDNWGLARSVVAGVTEICASHGRVIVLEDDLIVSPHFLAYMNESLYRYFDDEKIYQISGYQFPIPSIEGNDAMFLPFTTSWGWGTWQRAWVNFDPDMKGIARLKRDKSAKRAFDFENTYPCYRMLQNQQLGRVDSWAIRWYLSVFLLGGFTLFPAKSLVMNIGQDGSGTHDGSNININSLNFNFKVKNYPTLIEIDFNIYNSIVDYLKNIKSSSWKRVFKMMKNILNIISILKHRWFMRDLKTRARIGENSIFYSPARIINLLNDKNSIVVGDNCRIRGDLVVFAHGGQIRIGNYCFLGEGSRIWSSTSVEIGSRVLIAHNVTIMDNISHPTSASARHEHFRAIITTGHPRQIDLKEEAVVIHDDAWVGCMSIILPGVTIGRGAIVGAGSVVTKNVPPWTLAVGNPAVVIRNLPVEKPDNIVISVDELDEFNTEFGFGERKEGPR